MRIIEWFLLLIVASAIQRKQSRQVHSPNVENETLRSKLPARVLESVAAALTVREKSYFFSAQGEVRISH